MTKTNRKLEQRRRDVAEGKYTTPRAPGVRTRRSPYRTVKILELFPHKAEINVAINETQQVIFNERQTKIIEQRSVRLLTITWRCSAIVSSSTTGGFRK